MPRMSDAVVREKMRRVAEAIVDMEHGTYHYSSESVNKVHTPYTLEGKPRVSKLEALRYGGYKPTEEQCTKVFNHHFYKEAYQILSAQRKGGVLAIMEAEENAYGTISDIASSFLTILESRLKNSPQEFSNSELIRGAEIYSKMAIEFAAKGAAKQAGLNVLDALVDVQRKLPDETRKQLSERMKEYNARRATEIDTNTELAEVIAEIVE